MSVPQLIPFIIYLMSCIIMTIQPIITAYVYSDDAMQRNRNTERETGKKKDTKVFLQDREKNIPGYFTFYCLTSILYKSQ